MYRSVFAVCSLPSTISIDNNSLSFQEQHWPTIVAEGDGQGALIRVEMVISETCQKSKRKSVLASGIGNVVVKFGAKNSKRGGGDDVVGSDNSTSEQETKDGEWKANSAAVDREEGAMRKVRLAATVTAARAAATPQNDRLSLFLNQISTTTKSTLMPRASGGKSASGGSSSGRGGGPNPAGDYSNNPAQVEVPGPGESELTQTTRGLSDLEIGMYALLGVFCLAILVFLINCVSFAFR